MPKLSLKTYKHTLKILPKMFLIPLPLDSRVMPTGIIVVGGERNCVYLFFLAINSIKVEEENQRR